MTLETVASAATAMFERLMAARLAAPGVGSDPLGAA